jgi:hypothetical protein
MQNVVNKANFTNYPRVLAMIHRCEQLYEEVSQRLLHEGKSTLYEDERLFINMISRLNAQVLSTAECEGAEIEESRKRPAKHVDFPAAQQETTAITTLRSLVQDNDEQANAAHVSEGHDGDEPVKKPKKRLVADAEKKPAATKRAKK